MAEGAREPHRLPILATEPERLNPELVEIQLGHLCNNRCVFCSSGQATADGHARPIELQPVLDALQQAKAIDARKVTFLGGEPTLQRAFLPALEHALSLGFAEVEIFTNGVKAARRGFVDEVAALGTVSWRFSIQGADEASHDRAVEKPGAWTRICKAMENVRAVGHRLTANACINEHSYRSAPGYVDVVRRFGLSQLHIDVVRPSSAGRRSDAYLREIMPQHHDMAPFLDEMLRRFEAWDPDFDVNVGNFPYCALPHWAHRIHHGGMDTLTLASDLDNGLSPKDKYAAQHVDKVHGDACGGCVFRPRCSGVFDTYARLHGTGDLAPMGLEELRVRDPQKNAFALHAAPVVAWVREILERAGGSPRSAENGSTGHRSTGPRSSVVLGRCIELGVHADAPEGALVVARVGGLVQTLRLRAGPSVVSAALGERAAFDEAALGEMDRLRHGLGEKGDVAPRSLWVAAALGPKIVARGRAQIRRLLAELEGDREPDPDWPGVFVHARSRDEGAARVHLWVTPSGRVGLNLPDGWTPAWRAYAHAQRLLIGPPPPC